MSKLWDSFLWQIETLLWDLKTIPIQLLLQVLKELPLGSLSNFQQESPIPFMERDIKVTLIWIKWNCQKKKQNKSQFKQKSLKKIRLFKNNKSKNQICHFLRSKFEKIKQKFFIKINPISLFKIKPLKN